MQNPIFLFDVDGTLTPSRGKIDKSFGLWLKQFMLLNKVAFVTGSDIDKTIEQLGTELMSLAIYSFNCSSNTIYVKNNLIYQSDWKCPEEIVDYLLCKLNESVYNYKYGKHIEPRIGMINFSIVGRNASIEERKKYYEWDKIHGERLSLAKDINSKWNNIQAVVGGETGVDIFEKGHDKARILKHFKEHQKFVFFGDSMNESGNDYSLAQEILMNNRGICHTVSNWNETWNILREKYDSKN
jgi:phosphomannomutase